MAQNTANNVYPYEFALPPTAVTALTYGKQTSIKSTRSSVIVIPKNGLFDAVLTLDINCRESVLALLLLEPHKTFTASIIILPVVTLATSDILTP